MKQVRIFCIHPFCSDVSSFKDYLHIELPGIEFVWDENCPDYLISTEVIYSNRRCNKLFQKLYLKAKINIMVAFEAMCPDFNIFDYAVSYDCNLNNGDRFVQLIPPLVMFKGFLPISENLITSEREALDELKKKTGFCNFLYSNWKANPIRDELFFAISSYKRVDSLGRHLNNVGKRGTGYVGHSDECKDIKRPYKFSIACENASFRGYTSEKIYTSLIAHTVPIYWGDPEVVRNVNPNCFVNINNYNSMDDLIQAVRKIDQDDLLWAKMVSSPWRTEDQKSYHSDRENNYSQFFYNIFSQNIDDAVRIARGTFPNIARHFNLRSTPANRTKFLMLLEKLKIHRLDNELRKKYSL